MRIAFVSANRERLPDPVLPLGLLAVRRATPPGHETALWDLCFERRPLEALAERLDDWQPDLVAIGLRNLQNADYTGTADNIRYYRELVAAVRAHSAAPILLGGAGYSVLPGPLLETLGADHGIAGEGEAIFPVYVEALQAGDLDRVPGLWRLSGGVARQNPGTAPFLDMRQLPTPDYAGVDPRYFVHGAAGSVQTSRGCPLRCSYCTYPIIEGRLSRRRAPAQVVDDLEALRETWPEVDHVFVVDSVFTLPPRHARAVCDEMIARGWSVPWTCYGNPLGFDGRLAERMAAAGCAGIEIGSDSGDDGVLAAQRKGFTAARIREMSRTCRAAGLKDCHTFVLGLEGDTPDTVRRTLDFIDDMEPFAAILMMYVDDAEGLDPERAARRARLRDAIREGIAEACRAHPTWIAPQLGIHFDLRLFRILRKMGFRGPLWQHIHHLPPLPPFAGIGGDAHRTPVG